MLAGLAFFLVIVIVEAGVVSAFDHDISSLAARLVLQGLLAATLIVTALMFASPQLRELAPASVLGLRRPLRSPYVSMAIAYFGYIAVAILIAALLQPQQEDVTRDLGFGEGPLGSTAAALLIIVAAPISEEMFFRGFMFAGLRRSAPFVVAAVISSCRLGPVPLHGPGLLGRRAAALHLRARARLALRAHRIDLADDRGARPQQRDRVCIADVIDERSPRGRDGSVWHNFAP